MGNIIRVIILLCGVAFVMTVVYLLIKRKISEKNSLIWLLGSLIILALSAIPNLLDIIAQAAGVDYPPTLLFLFSTLVLLFLTLNHSIQISVLNEQIRELSQHIAINETSRSKLKV